MGKKYLTAFPFHAGLAVTSSTEGSPLAQPKPNPDPCSPVHPSLWQEQGLCCSQRVPASPGGHRGGAALWRTMESQGGKTLDANPPCVPLTAMGWAKGDL